ncbi:DNA phosphorothioation-dependent restriction protein DptH [Pontibacter sp. G13]|uniref:DNA phosphorothioation-dependent restriction protein DptH n=1 Tax=Pontibacter sp. G13 TaxID=3074898 RepID=UPI002889E725|nr:DNA phosphorothioation-dependent restriction protein DptH [Pontibacter sp. G13]WNJ17164.1 DNA phosphorothioation-dependent restriction protein DptH [Pontibacter sp. G13]
MPNTLDQFNSYIAKELFKYFSADKPIQAGEKYSLYLEQPEWVEKLYNKLQEAVSQKEGLSQRDFTYSHGEHNEFNSFCIEFNGVSLLIASSELATEHYLTLLRNMISAQEGKFRGVAILILYSGQLDSLEGGSASLTKSGMPFNFDVFANKLKQQIKGFGGEDLYKKVILYEKLNTIINENVANTLSIYDLSKVVEIMESDDISAKDYAKLGLFPNQELATLTDEKQIKKKLETNFNWFERIEYSMNYGNPSEDFNGVISDDGLKRLVKAIGERDGLGEIDFADICKWTEKPKDEPVKFLEIEGSKGVEIWDKPDGKTTAKQRRRSIIIFNPNFEDTLELSVKFDSFLKGKQLRKVSLGSNITLKTSGKSLEVTFEKLREENRYYQFEYHDPNVKNNKFIFKVLVLPITSELIEDISATYALGKGGVLELKAEHQVVLNGRASTVTPERLISGDEYFLSEDGKLVLTLGEEEEEEVVPFRLNLLDKTTIDVNVRVDVEHPTTIKGHKVWIEKIKRKKSFRYTYTTGKNGETLKLLLNNQEYYVKDEFRTNILLEKEILKEYNFHAWEKMESDAIVGLKLNLSEELISAFSAFMKSFERDITTPSLAFWSEAQVELAKKYVETFINELNNIPSDTSLSITRFEELIKLGTVYENYGQRILKFSPLHPLNVAYQLALYDDVGGIELNEVLVEKLSPLNLLPYIKWYNPSDSNEPLLYGAKENDHSLEWLYYSNDVQFKQLSGKLFVKNLVKQKIIDFTTNFNFLFDYNSHTPLKLNVVNLGDCLHVLQGIFEYYKHELSKKKALSQLRPIDVYIYGSDRYVSKFEELSFINDVEKLEKSIGISSNSKTYSFSDLVNVVREKVHYFSHSLDDLGEYTHLTFFQFNEDDIQISETRLESMPTGVSLNGIINDIPSTQEGNAYRTGFGTQYLKKDPPLLKVAKGMNALCRVAFTQNLYDKDKGIGTLVKKEVNDKLKSFYEHSQWITFVDPRFDLSFFKNDDDIVIIHYSDQYSNTSGFDAITVTQKHRQYRYVLDNYFKGKEVEHSEKELEDVINLFNAVNGEWLLKVLSEHRNENFKREKLSIFSAIKTFWALFDHDDVIWVPIALEEILRVSGGAGLKMSDGLFSSKNLGKKGSVSDDLLMIGITEVEGQLSLKLYPIEVKIGQNHSGIIDKAKKQAKETYKLIYEFLEKGQNDKTPYFVSKLYRNFFAKLAIMSASKMKLYDIWLGKDWDLILNEYRSRLLNDDFTLESCLSEHLGEYAVMAFSKDETGVRTRRIEKDGDCLTVELFEKDGYELLLKPVEYLVENFVDRPTTLNQKFFLREKQLQRTKQLDQVKPFLSYDMKELKPLDILEEPQVEEFESDNLTGLKTTRIPPSFDCIIEEERKEIYKKLLDKFDALRIGVEQKHFSEVQFLEGPAFFRIGIYPNPETKQSKIESILEEINLTLGLPQEESVRLFRDLGELWLEVPKRHHQKVKVTTQLLWDNFQKTDDFAIPFGVDIEGNVIPVTLSSSNSPHMLIAGTTGSGKSVVLDTIIHGAIKYYTHEDLNLFLIDPKGNELIDFEDEPHVQEPNGETPDDAIDLLERGVDEMQRRYQQFKELRKTGGKAAKDILDYNERATGKMARWIIVLDEYADLVEEDAEKRKEIESLLKRLSQKARAAGIHVILATQKPLASVVSSTIKANLPAALALKVKTSGDSRVILDEKGAETLVGNGDSLFKNGKGKVVRVQCAIHE